MAKGVIYNLKYIKHSIDVSVLTRDMALKLWATCGVCFMFCHLVEAKWHRRHRYIHVNEVTCGG